MKQLLLLSLLFLRLPASSQEKTCSLLADEKKVADSLMGIQNGEVFFSQYFTLNPKSGGRTKFEFQNWNDTTSDSIRYY